MNVYRRMKSNVVSPMFYVTAIQHSNNKLQPTTNTTTIFTPFGSRPPKQSILWIIFWPESTEDTTASTADG